MLVNGAKVHISLEISEFCDENQIVLYVLLPNSMHLIQPLDLLTMGSMKSIYRDMVHHWSSDNPFKVYDRDAFVEVFPKLCECVFTEDNRKNGFKEAGLYHWNPIQVDQKKLFPGELYDRRLCVDVPAINQPTETVEASAVTQVQDEMVTPTSKDENEVKKMARSIVLDGIKYDLVMSPVAPVAAEKRLNVTSPPLADVFPSTSTGGEIVQKEKDKVTIIDEILTTPKQAAAEKTSRRSRAHVSGLPRAVSDKRFWEMLQKQKDEKDQIAAEKVKRKEEHEAAKKKKEEEKEKRKIEKEKVKVAKAKVGRMNRVVTRRKKKVEVYMDEESSESSSEYDDSSSTKDEEWSEGSTSTCWECFKQFIGREKQLAIGCAGWKVPTFSYFSGFFLLFPTLGSNSYFFLLFHIFQFSFKGSTWDADNFWQL